MKSSATTPTSATWSEATGCSSSAGRAGEIYNLGSGQGLKLADALHRLTELATRPIEVRVDPARVRPVDLPLLVADPSKLKAEVGWTPIYSIDQTLKDMLATFRGSAASS